MRRRLALLLASLLLALLVAEGAVRVLELAPAPLRLRQIYRVRKDGSDQLLAEWGTARLLQPSPLPALRELRGEFFPGVTFKACYDGSGAPLRPYFDPSGCVTATINADRLRGPRVPLARSTDTLRLAGVGDSFTFGDGVPLEATFLHLLGTRLTAVLRETGAGLRCETVNLGVPGFSVRDVALYTEHRALAYTPDVVLYTFYLNDILIDGPDVSETQAVLFRQAYLEPTGLGHASAMVDFLQRRGARERLAEASRHMYREAFADPALWQTCRRLLLRMKRLCDRVDARFLLAVFPVLTQLDGGYPYVAEHEQLMAFCRKNDIPAVDLLPAFLGRRAEDLWVHPTDPHANELGHRLAAERMLSAVRGLFPWSR